MKPTKQLISLLYASALGSLSWPTMLEALARETRSSIAVLCPLRVGAGARPIATAGSQQLMADYEDSRWGAINPEEEFIAAFQAGEINLRAFSTATIRRESPGKLARYEQGFLRPRKMGDFANLFLCFADGKTAALGLTRSEGVPDFAAPDIELLGEIGEHLEQALTVASETASDDATRLLVAFEHTGMPAVLLDGQSRVVAATTLAHAMFKTHLQLEGGRLTFTSSAGQSTLDDLLGRCRDAGTVAGIAQADNGTPLLMRAIRLEWKSPNSGWDLRRERVETVLLLGDMSTERSDAVQGADALEALGLSPAEARVAILVGNGMAPVRAAEIFQLKESTVRSHLKQTYLKLGISRQGELAQIAAKARELSPRPR